MELRYCPLCAKELVTKDLADRPRRACPDPDCGWCSGITPCPWWPVSWSTKAT